ncbi:hypothetical protein CPB84DRAFT_1712682 [Gymnopilus junonius]|uniref:F-box domain-containing protein n=1 Tax=Gymnopilus junonius TaxID=109634 RepID=A0A9P5TKC0_GYMJU|nr:hypothetical protein CPB84DRAFT_1712682 [Gymnopilus junonius]
MSLVLWSSPVRQRGKKVLPPIPNEIYLEIFKHLRPPMFDPWFDRNTVRHLACLALVCRFFCSIAVPWMFESLEIMFRATKSGKASRNRQKFCTNVAERMATATAAANLVKRCSICCFTIAIDEPEDPAAVERECLSLYSKAMWHMSSLNELLLSSISLTKEFVLSVANLQNLKALSIHDCSLADEVNIRHLRGVSSLRLERLVATFTDTDGQAILDGNTAAAMHSFFDQLTYSSMLDLSTSSWYLIKQLAKCDEVLPLQKLSMYFVNDLDVMATLFQRTPFLKTLRALGIIPLLEDPDLIFHLDTKVLPMLEDTEAPVPVLSALVPGRPISTLRILQLAEMYPKIEDEEIKAFTSSSSFIHFMQIPGRLYNELPFHQHFPHLHILQMNFTKKDIEDDKHVMNLQHLSELTHSWPKHPPLHTLRLDFEGISMVERFLDLKKQHEWVSKILMPKIPTLRKFCLAEFIQWSYCDTEKAWKPKLSPTYVGIFITLWQVFKKEIEYVDFDGYFDRWWAISMSTTRWKCTLINCYYYDLPYCIPPITHY